MKPRIDAIKKVEGETLGTFREEIPSIYFSHKSLAEYKSYIANAEYVYRELFKFPPQMFRGAQLIDFGAGTGENTIYLANWGAACTLVEMNSKAQDISKEVFKKHSQHFDQHKFVLSSIFDYAPGDEKQYDIVHCRGVLSHTAANEQAFRRIAAYVKPGGYLIFGDPNKAGGFQNMLQRLAVYRFAASVDEMVNVSEFLFKEDIDRSERFIPRTRRAIIFDRWVIQSQDDPSIAEVMGWVHKSGLRFYTSYPPFVIPLGGDSAHHRPKLETALLTEFAALTELVWMLQTEPDSDALPRFSIGLSPVSTALANLTSYVANFNKHTKIDVNDFHDRSHALAAASVGVNFLNPLRDKLLQFLDEADEFVSLVDASDLKKVRQFIEMSKVLFKGACGVRHVDFIAYKPETQVSPQRTTGVEEA